MEEFSGLAGVQQLLRCGEEFADGGDIGISIVFVDVGTPEGPFEFFYELDLPEVAVAPTDPHQQRLKPEAGVGSNERGDLTTRLEKMGAVCSTQTRERMST